MKTLLMFLIASTCFAKEVIPKGLTKKDMPRFNELFQACMIQPGAVSDLKLVMCKIKAHKAIIESKG